MKLCSIEGCQNKLYARNWCNAHYLRWFKYGDPLLTKTDRRPPNQSCEALGCLLKAVWGGYCQKHKRRKDLYGDPLYSPVAEWGSGYVNKKGYYEIHLKGHPIAHKDGKLLYHRMILFDAIGPNNHYCHWQCGTLLSWFDGTLESDHIDHDKSNNDISNLVPSCKPCNSKRAKAYHSSKA